MFRLIRHHNLLNDNFFSDFFNTSNTPLLELDIIENEESYRVLADLPGYQKEDIQVGVDKGYLTITAERIKEETESKELRSERFYGKLKRSFYIGDYTVDDLSGTFKDGVLEIIITKKEDEKKKFLEIK